MSNEHLSEGTKPDIQINPLLSEESMLPFRLKVNSESIAQLMRFAGMSDEAIARHQVVFSPETPRGLGNTHLGGSYAREDQRIFVFPTVLWNYYQTHKFLADTATIGRGTLSHLEFMPPRTIKVQGMKVDPLKPKERSKNYKKAQKWAAEELDKPNRQTFLDGLKNEDFETTDRILLDNLNRLLVATIAHEIRHATDLYSPKLEELKLHAVGISSIAVPVAVTYLLSQLPIFSDRDILDATLIVSSALFSHYTVLRESPRVIYKFSLSETRARKFAKMIQDQPVWVGLAQIEPNSNPTPYIT